MSEIVATFVSENPILTTIIFLCLLPFLAFGLWISFYLLVGAVAVVLLVAVFIAAIINESVEACVRAWRKGA